MILQFTELKTGKGHVIHGKNENDCIRIINNFKGVDLSKCIKSVLKH